MLPVILVLSIAILLIIAYGINATARMYIRLFLMFLFIILVGLIGALVDVNMGLDGNFSIIFSIGAATIFIVHKNKDK